MKKHAYEVFLEVAVSAARDAGAVIMKGLGTLGSRDIDAKQAADFVTRVDRESEKVIIDAIAGRFPEHHFLAEESRHDSETTGHRWIVDPLDGTTNFIHGFPQFSVSIALQLEAKTLIGVVFDPVRNELFSAVAGQGATCNGKRMHVSGLKTVRRALIATGFPFKQHDMIAPYLSAFKEVLSEVSDLRRAGSAALDLSYVAAGRCDGFFEIGLSPWDLAAGDLLIREAGGVFTDFGGGPEYFATGNIVAGPAAIHKMLLSIVKRNFGGILDS